MLVAFYDIGNLIAFNEIGMTVCFATFVSEMMRCLPYGVDKGKYIKLRVGNIFVNVSEETRFDNLVSSERGKL